MDHMFFEQENIIDPVAMNTKNASENFLKPLLLFAANVKNSYIIYLSLCIQISIIMFRLQKI